MRWLHTRIDPSRDQGSHRSESSVDWQRDGKALLDRPRRSHAARGRSPNTLFRSPPRTRVSPRIGRLSRLLLLFYGTDVSYWFYRKKPCCFPLCFIRQLLYEISLYRVEKRQIQCSPHTLACGKLSLSDRMPLYWQQDWPSRHHFRTGKTCVRWGARKLLILQEFYLLSFLR